MNIKKLLALTLFAVMFLTQPLPAHAWWGHHRGHHYTKVIVNGAPYYYAEGYYYTANPSGYVVVDAPAGAVITELPANYEVVEIQGKRYFRHQKTYYLRVDGGYQVVYL